MLCAFLRLLAALFEMLKVLKSGVGEALDCRCCRGGVAKEGSEGCNVWSIVTRMGYIIK